MNTKKILLLISIYVTIINLKKKKFYQNFLQENNVILLNSLVSSH